MTSFLHGWPVLFLTATAAAGDILKYAVADHYAVLVSTVYQDSLAGAVALGETVDRFLAADEALVERMTKKGMRTFDARGAVRSLVVLAEAEGAGRTSLDVVLRHGTPAVRPDDVLRGLDAVAGLAAGEAPMMTRLAQGPLLESGAIGDPLASRL